ncbi:MAG: hypothetical protein ACJ8FS_15370 [Sphingomicrobium sp.]
MFDKPFGTVKRILQEVGDWALHFCENEPPVAAEFIQADEMWTFIWENDRGSKKKKPEDRGGETGVSWLWMAIDKNTKFILTTHVGTRQTADATIFLRRLSKKLQRDERGEFVTVPTLSVDGHKAYVDAIELAFGTEIHSGQLVKIYSKAADPVTGEVPPGARYTGSRKRAVTGDPDFDQISTWRIERENGYFRQASSRFGRKRNSFSKQKLFHERAVALLKVYRNYCWVPRPSRPRDGSKQWTKNVTAAMAAGLTDHPWTIHEVMEASDEFKLAGQIASNDNSGQSGATEGTHPFWVFHVAYQRRARVHASCCRACNDGQGKMGGKAQRGRWYGFDTVEEAIAYAEKLERHDAAECRWCLAEYETRGFWGRRF